MLRTNKTQKKNTGFKHKNYELVQSPTQICMPTSGLCIEVAVLLLFSFGLAIF